MNRYDADSGLVFRETIVRPSKAKAKSWQHVCNGGFPDYKRVRRGADSLFNCAMRKIIARARDLETIALADVPPLIVRAIWKELRKSGRESFHVWKLFAESGAGNRSFRHLVHAEPTQTLMTDFFSEVASPRFTWLTDLTLEDVGCSAADLKQLSVMPNLISLRVLYSNPGQNFDDGVLESLSWKAKTEGALSRLETFWVQGALRVTSRAVTFLRQFPALDVFCVSDTGIRTEHDSIGRNGWRTCESSTFGKLYNDRKSRAAYDSASSSLHINVLADSYLMLRHREMPANDTADLPVLRASFSHCGVLARVNKQTFFCFERDWVVCPRPSSPRLPPPTIQTRDEAGETLLDPTPKRRKLKAGKALALESILETF